MRIVVQVSFLLVVCLAVFGHAAPGVADAGDAPGVRPFDRCLEVSGESASGTAWLELSASDRGEDAVHSRARLSWSEGEGELRVRLQMLAPDDVAGSAILLVESESSGDEPRAWAYLPELESVRRVGGRHLRKPLFGTNLRYEDLDRARQLAIKGSPDSWSEAEYKGRPVWRIDARAGRDRLTTWLDRERCVPLRTEVTDRKGRVARLLQVSAEATTHPGEGFVPRELVVRDLLADSETRVRVESVDLVAAPPETLFDPAFLATAVGAVAPPASPAQGRGEAGL